MGQDLVGAPYDWRYAPDAQGKFHKRLQELVENTTVANHKKVVLATDSNGPMIIYDFLTKMSQEWKDKYVCGFFPTSPVWGGTVSAVYDATVGNDRFKPITSADVRDVILTWPSLLWNFPRIGSTYGTFNSSQIIVKTPTRNYTAAEMGQYLTDLGFPAATKLWEKVTNVTSRPFPNPGVDTFVTYGTGLGTIASITIEEPLPGAKTVPKVKPADGDGDHVVLTSSSLRGNVSWAEPMAKSGKRLDYKAYPDMKHASCFLNATCIKDATLWLASLKCDL